MKLKNWLQLLFIVVVLSIGFFGSRWEKRLLKNCHKETMAIIVDKHTRSNRGYFIRYTYKVDGKAYESSESLKGKSEINSLHEGHSIKIRYSCENPDVSTFKKLE